MKGAKKPLNGAIELSLKKTLRFSLSLSFLLKPLLYKKGAGGRGEATRGEASAGGGRAAARGPPVRPPSPARTDPALNLPRNFLF